MQRIWTCRFGLVLGLLPVVACAPSLTRHYNCVPLEVAVLETSAHVLCAPPNPAMRSATYPLDDGREIRYFAVPLSKADFAGRFIQLSNTAMVSGHTMFFKYTSGATSNVCSYDNCRTPWAFGIARDAFVP